MHMHRTSVSNGYHLNTHCRTSKQTYWKCYCKKESNRLLDAFFPQLHNYPGLLADLTDAYFILFLLLLSPLLTTPIASLEHPVCFLTNSQKLASCLSFFISSEFPFFPALLCIYLYLYLCEIHCQVSQLMTSVDWYTLTGTHPSSSLTLCRFLSHRVLSRKHSLQKLHS